MTHISAWHYRGMVNATITQFQHMFVADTRLHGNKQNEAYKHTIAHNETIWGGVFYPWSDKFENIPIEMIPYFVTCHVNSHTVLNYISSSLRDLFSFTLLIVLLLVKPSGLFGVDVQDKA